MGNKSQGGSIMEGKMQHSRLGLIQILENSGADSNIPAEYSQYIALQSQAFSNSQYKKWQQELMFYAGVNLAQKEARKSIQSQTHYESKQSYKLQPLKLNEDIKQLMFLPFACEIKQSGFCGSACLLQIRYPNYSIVLRDQIKDRWKVEKFYLEEELWYLLYNLILLERYFEPYDRKIGNVHPNNILISQQGVMQVITNFSIPKQKQNFEIICQSQLQDAFLAPEQIQYDALKRCRYPDINQNLAQIFSIGMTVLQAGTLQLSTYLYDRGPYRINSTKLKNNLNLFRSKYGAFLTNIVEGMLAQKPKNRRTSHQLYRVLNPFEQQIFNLQPFTSKITNPQMSKRAQSNNSHFNSILNNSGSTIKSAKMIQDDMCETKVLRQFPPPYKYHKNNPIHSQKEQAEQLGDSSRFYSPRIVRSTFTN